MHATNIGEAEPFITKDGATIREVVGGVSLPSRNQSLAEATIPVDGATDAHFHRVTEELYFSTAGTGRLRVAGEDREVSPGDCVVIPPGAQHKLWNTGDVPLVLLCCCSPAYSHEDTVITE